MITITLENREQSAMISIKQRSRSEAVEILRRGRLLPQLGRKTIRRSEITIVINALISAMKYIEIMIFDTTYIYDDWRYSFLMLKKIACNFVVTIRTYIVECLRPTLRQ